MYVLVHVEDYILQYWYEHSDDVNVTLSVWLLVFVEFDFTGIQD
jgi:hypothetical protein